MRRRIAMDMNRGPQARMPWQRRMLVAAQDAFNQIGAPWREARRPDEGVDRGDGRVHHEERVRGLEPNRGLELGQMVRGQGAGAGAVAPHGNNNDHPDEHDQFIVEERRRGRIWGF